MHMHQINIYLIQASIQKTHVYTYCIFTLYMHLWTRPTTKQCRFLSSRFFWNWISQVNRYKMLKWVGLGQPTKEFLSLPGPTKNFFCWRPFRLRPLLMPTFPKRSWRVEPVDWLFFGLLGYSMKKLFNLKPRSTTSILAMSITYLFLSVCFCDQHVLQFL